MYKLFYSPGSAAIAPHVVLEEIGQPHELVRVDTAVGAHKRPDYLKLNPHGRVPTLADSDLVIYEAAAITLHLADANPKAYVAIAAVFAGTTLADDPTPDALLKTAVLALMIVVIHVVWLLAGTSFARVF